MGFELTTYKTEIQISTIGAIAAVRKIKTQIRKETTLKNISSTKLTLGNDFAWQRFKTI